MAKSKTTFEKMLREKKKREKQQDKKVRKEIKKAQKDDALPLEDGEDPDLAGIVAGPQPISDDW